MRTRIVDQVATVMWGAVRMAVAGAAGRVLVLYTIAIMGRTLAVGGGSTTQKFSTKLNSYCSLATCYATTRASIRVLIMELTSKSAITFQFGAYPP